MDIEKHLEGLVEVRFLGGFLRGRRAYMSNPEFRMMMKSREGEPCCYRRRTVELLNGNGAGLTVATYAPDDLADHDFTHLVVEAARKGTFKGKLK